jgi:IclR family transcriptional regulator, pca regulon regulatory protein
MNNPSDPQTDPQTALENDPNFIGALARGLSVIRSFDQHHEQMTLSQVASVTGLARATARRCLLTLETLGYIHSDGKQFRLTPQILTLGQAYLTSTPLVQLIEPSLEQVSQQTGESCSASVLDQAEIVYLARSATRRIMSVGLGPGSRLPAYCTSMGRVLLAHLPSTALEQYLERTSLTSYTSHTITDPTQLRRTLELIRHDGYALVDQELELGLRSIAVPISNARGQVVAAMNVSTHVGRTSKGEMLERFLPALRHATEHLRLILHT